MSEIERFLSFIKTFYSTINTLTKSRTHNWHKTFTIHVPNLITADFFLSSQFTTNAQNVLRLSSGRMERLRMVWKE